MGRILFLGNLLVLSALLPGCGPEDASGRVPAWVETYDVVTRTYALAPDHVDNLESMRALRGRDVELRSGAGFTGVTERLVDHGRAFSFHYTLDAKGYAVPSELEDAYAVSVYRDLDRISSLLRDHGHLPETRLQVFYFPYADNALVGDDRTSLMDNAAYDFQHHVFLILPSFLFNRLPLLLNQGVLGHEFGHSVIQQTVFAGRAFEPARDNSRALASMHEGAADLIGFVVSADPNFIAPSLATDRDLSEPQSYTETDATELLSLASTTFDPHRHGSILARALYEAWPKAADGSISPDGRGRMLDVLLASLRDLNASFTPASFTLASLPNAWVTHLPQSDLASTCAVLRLRLAPLFAELTNCPVPT